MTRRPATKKAAWRRNCSRPMNSSCWRCCARRSKSRRPRALKDVSRYQRRLVDLFEFQRRVFNDPLLDPLDRPSRGAEHRPADRGIAGRRRPCAARRGRRCSLSARCRHGCGRPQTHERTRHRRRARRGQQPCRERRHSGRAIAGLQPVPDQLRRDRGDRLRRDRGDRLLGAREAQRQGRRRTIAPAEESQREAIASLGAEIARDYVSLRGIERELAITRADITTQQRLDELVESRYRASFAICPIASDPGASPGAGAERRAVAQSPGATARAAAESARRPAAGGTRPRTDLRCQRGCRSACLATFCAAGPKGPAAKPSCTWRRRASGWPPQASSLRSRSGSSPICKSRASPTSATGHRA